MKRLLLVAILISIFATAAFAEEQPASESEEPELIGLTFKLDYYSTYFFRGAYFYGGDGAFCPSLAYDVLKSGVVVTTLMELSESWVLDGSRNGNGSIKDSSGTGFAWHGLDLGVDYGYTINNTVTIGISYWYYWYFNANNAWQVRDADTEHRQNWNYFTLMHFVQLPFLPLKPQFQVYYDYYYFQRESDFYFVVKLSEELELAKRIYLGFSFSVGYKYCACNFPESQQQKGFSDITTMVNLIYRYGHSTVNGGFSYIIVPHERFCKLRDENDRRYNDIHRYYATFGAGYRL